MRIQLWIFFVLFLVISTGCDKNISTSQPLATSESKVANDALKQVPNHEYLCWARFPVGTTVTRCKELTSEIGTTRVTTTFKLVAKSEDRVSVDSQTKVERPTETTENPAQTFEYKAYHRIPSNVDEAKFRLPVPDAKTVANEKLEVNGKSYDAVIYTWDSQLESGPVGIKAWYSDDFPGRQLKMEIDFRNNGASQGKELIVEVAIPETPKT